MARRCLALLVALSSAVVLANCTELRESTRSREMALEAEWNIELQPLDPNQPKQVEYKSPIKRVVALLRKMKAELEYEAKHDAEMYDKMVCWCETNEKEKRKAISDADAKDERLTAEIEARSGRFGSLSTEIEALKKEIAEMTDALKEATAIRDKEADAFIKEQTSLTQAITNVKNAIIILSKHHSFMQVGSTTMLGVKTVLRDLAMKREMLVDHDASMQRSMGVQSALIAIGSTSERASEHAAQGVSRELLRALDVKAGGVDDSLPLKFAERLLSDSAGKATSATVFLQLDKPASYAAQSGVIYGMLKQMKDDFDVALERTREDEKRAAKDFDEMSAAKAEQIEASKKKLDEMEGEDAENAKALADAKEDLETTREQRSADVKFLTNLKETCQDLNAQWEERSKTRSAEIQAVSQALAIILEDDNADMLRGSVKFLQLGSMTKDARRAQAAEVLQDGLNDMFNGAGELLDAWEDRHGSSDNSAIKSASDSLHHSRTQLAALSITVRMDSFDKVLAAMDKLVVELKKQQKEEVEFKAKCRKDLHTNEKTTAEKTDEKEDLEGSIKELDTTIDTLRKEIKEASEQISETEVAKKKASQDREEENAQFQRVVADQRATQDILKKALAKLQAFYKKAALAQVDNVQTPPAQFGSYKENSGSSPVMAMIESIIQDSAKLEAESVAGEKKAQAEYEKFVKDSNDVIDSSKDAVTKKSQAVAAADEKLATAKGDLETTNGILEDLAKVAGDLHAECDWLMKNFDRRQKARASEIEAIQTAKGILSGAK